MRRMRQAPSATPHRFDLLLNHFTRVTFQDDVQLGMGWRFPGAGRFRSLVCWDKLNTIRDCFMTEKGVRGTIPEKASSKMT